MLRPNFARWKELTADLPSPDILIESGFYFMIGAALQRRVWMNDLDHYPLFANPYMLYVMRPGGGKGLVSSMVKDLLEYHGVTPKDKKGNVRQDNLAVLAARPNRELMFPIGPDIASFAALAEFFKSAKATRMFRPTPPFPRGVGETYVYNSVALILDEFTSMFNENSKEALTFFLSVFNGKNVDKQTKNNGEDWIFNPLLSILGGTQPDEFGELIKKRVVASGLASRFLIIYAPHDDRKRSAIRKPLTEHQVEVREHFYGYLYELSKAFGQVSLSPEAAEWIEAWWKDKKRVTVNTSPALESYYSRKAEHLQKMSIIMAFSEDPATKVVSLDVVKEALAYLDRIEVDMHMPFSYQGSNKLASVIPRILTYVGSEGFVTLEDIQETFIADLRTQEVNELMESLISSGQLRVVVSANKTVHYALGASRSRKKEEVSEVC